MKNERKTIIALGILPFVMVVGNSMFIPILPTIEDSLNISPAQTGFILTAFSIPAAFIIPFCSYFADKFGKKKLIFISLSFVATGSFISALTFFIPSATYSYGILILGRILQGVGSGGLSPLAMGVISELSTGVTRSKALGATEVFNSFGKMVSPFLGIMAVMITWEFSFLLYFVLSIITFFSIYHYVKLNEKRKDVKLIKYGQSVILVVKQNYKILLPFFYFGGILLFCLFGLLVYLTYELDAVYGISGLQKGVVFTIPFGMMTISSYISGNIIGKGSKHFKYVMFISMLALFLSLICGMLQHSFIFLLIIFATFSGGVGLMLPCCNYLVATNVNIDERGIALSLYGMIRFIGVASAPIIFTNWMEREWWMFLYTFLLIALGTFLVIFGWLWTENEKYELKRV